MVSPTEILNHLGIEFSDRGGYLLFCSPLRDDKNPSMAFYKDSLMVIDFGGSYKEHVVHFVKDVTGESYYKVFNEDRGVYRQEQYLSAFKNSLQTGRNPTTSLDIDITLEGSFYSVFENKEALEYCYGRGMETQFMADFNVLYFPYGIVNGTKFYKRIGIPIVEGGKLISIEGRAISKDNKPKVLYPKNCSVSSLWNIDHLDPSKDLVVVEGLMDLLRIYSHITENVTCVFGVQLAERQKYLLNKFPKVILYSDSDEAGEGLLTTFSEFYEYEFKVVRGPEKDPGEATVESLRKNIEGAVEYTRYIMNKVGLFSTPKIEW